MILLNKFLFKKTTHLSVRETLHNRGSLIQVGKYKFWCVQTSFGYNCSNSFQMTYKKGQAVVVRKWPQNNFLKNIDNNHMNIAIYRSYAFMKPPYETQCSVNLYNKYVNPTMRNMDIKQFIAIYRVEFLKMNKL